MQQTVDKNMEPILANDLLCVPLTRLMDEIRTISKKTEADMQAVFKAIAKLQESEKVYCT